jgi:levanase
VRTGAGVETVVGVDAKRGELFVDRTRSGQVAFNPEFDSREPAPLRAENGRVRLRVLVDWSSVEVFAGAGETVITDQIFPPPGSDGVSLYAEGGTARLVSLDAWPLRSAWKPAAARASDGRR